MPQATLLDFFKSQTPGPFAPVDHSTLSSLSEGTDTPGDELEESKEGDSTRKLSLAQATHPTEQRVAGRALRQAPSSTDAEARHVNSPSFEPHLPGLEIVAVQIDHLPALKRLTGNLLPVRYPDKFFDGAVNEAIPATFSRVALIDGKPVGWIRCRLDPFPDPTEPPSKTKPIYNRIYVQALCLLAPYRGLGIAKSLLGAVTAPPLPSEHDIVHIYAHVWESNEEALEWYDRRGFRKAMKVEQYYRKLRPDGAWVVQKDLDRL